MNRLLCLIFISTIICFTMQTTNAQTLVGNWHNPTYQETLQFTANGTYTLTNASGTFYGQCWANNNILSLQQDMYSNVMQYQVTVLTASDLQVIDANGQYFNYTRQGSVPQQETASTTNYDNNTPIEDQDWYKEMNANYERWAAEKGMTVPEYLEYLKGFNASMNTMQRMQLESHATSLNIIENMGGTGNYWEVKDY